jgi:predicted DNA binding CopG/RHH family protein
MEKPVNAATIPHTDSIQELARFWDTHELTDFEDQLEEVTEPVFERKTELTVRLEPEEIQAISEVAKSRGVDSADLIREWVLERVRASRSADQTTGPL